MKALHSHLLTLACGAIIGGVVVISLRDQRNPIATEAPRMRQLDDSEVRATQSELESIQERRKSTGLNTRRTRDAGDLTFLSNGNIIVPSELAERIHIYGMDTEGNVDAAELSLIGISAEDSKKLQDAIDELKKWEIERESRLAQIIRKSDAEILIQVPGQNVDDLKKQEFEKTVDLIIGKSRPFVQGSLSQIRSLTSEWGAADKVVTARPFADGYTEYKLYRYRASHPPSLKNGGDPSENAMSTTTFRAKEIPDRLRHLFDK